jgi:hypothetical protein
MNEPLAVGQRGLAGKPAMLITFVPLQYFLVAANQEESGGDDIGVYHDSVAYASHFIPPEQ